MHIALPDLSLVVLVGASGAGKSTFAAKHFLPTEVLSSDTLRGWVSDDPADQSATADAFVALHHLARTRLRRGRLTVVDATNVRAEDRRDYVRIAREFHALPVAIVLKTPPDVCRDRNAARGDRAFGYDVVRKQAEQVRRGLKGLRREGFRHVWTLGGVEAVDAATVTRQPLWCRAYVDDAGPFDLIGDVHGCVDELRTLLGRLGYTPDRAGGFTPPAGRKAVFVGDLVDRGPDSVGVLRTVMTMCEAGDAYCVPGNHDVKLMRALRGKDVRRTHGLGETLAQIDALPDGERGRFSDEVAGFIDGLVSHLVLDGGRLVVAHAGLPESMQGRGSGRVREFCLYGDTTGSQTPEGLPERLDWAADYAGEAAVVHGHVAVSEAVWRNNVLDLDTGCVFGGKLSALRWPERDVVQVPAVRTYHEPPVPLAHPVPELRGDPSELPDLDTLLGKRGVETELMGRVTLRATQTAAALEVVSRFAVDPRWLVHLPPTMSPCETAKEDRDGGPFLEHPAEAFAHYRKAGVREVVCEEKHMGSRAILAVCRDADAARNAFHVDDGTPGECWTRTGRRFFPDGAMHAAVLDRVRAAVTDAGLWDELETDWVCLDAEILPWNAKAGALVREQYAPVAAAGLPATDAAVRLLGDGVARGLDLADDRERMTGRHADLVDYRAAYRRYCGPVGSVDDLRVAPFHLLAAAGRVFHDRPHAWHLDRLDRLAAADPSFFLVTERRFVDTGDHAQVAAATDWWSEKTAAGGEGMVVKPAGYTVRAKRGLVQPGVKCRGREYLRIIYGPHYTDPANLSRLRNRSLGRKRGLALREYALGIESLRRFTAGEGVRRYHPCVFGVLALESEPVDPRL